MPVRMREVVHLPTLKNTSRVIGPVREPDGGCHWGQWTETTPRGSMM